MVRLRNHRRAQPTSRLNERQKPHYVIRRFRLTLIWFPSDKCRRLFVLGHNHHLIRYFFTASGASGNGCNRPFTILCSESKKTRETSGVRRTDSSETGAICHGSTGMDRNQHLGTRAKRECWYGQRT